MKKAILSLLLVASFSTVLAQNTAEQFTSSIEKAHQKESFFAKKYISYAIDIKFGGKDYMKGLITQETGGGKIKIEKPDGTTIIFDGTNVYGKGVPAKAKGGARFDIFTWSYFLGLPYKLNDSGTIWSDFVPNKWGKEKLNTGKLAFESGTGDAPDDWYVVYKTDKNTLAGAAYIVSFGKGKEVAEKEPHAIKYNNYTTVQGIPFATNWTFHMWSLKDGYTAQIGEVNLSDIKFLEQANFSIPEGSEIINAPK
ncbi:heat-shock protein Hsp90 [uncultured Tenacibaculum sp.]|uniref:heat-shock protein Hsp90 n=1 Tax=uncultured Tenacibaculum sp. TaxID=174713 RepID=UPI00262EF65C|nr:heat-shock protein Hsp90 [uncultured Tenacibaculum sp.]